jgi:hypothetical protein
VGPGSIGASAQPATMGGRAVVTTDAGGLFRVSVTDASCNVTNVWGSVTFRVAP